MGPLRKLGDQIETFVKVRGPKLQQKKLGDQIETFVKVRRPKLQQKKLGDQIETFAKVRGPKLHLSLYFISHYLIYAVENKYVFYIIFI